MRYEDDEPRYYEPDPMQPPPQAPEAPAPPPPSPSAPAPAASTPPPPPAFDRTAFRDAWMGTGDNVAAQDDLLRLHGISLDAAGRGRLPSGDLLDLRFGAKAGINRASWTTVNDPQTPGFENAASVGVGGSSGGAAGGAPSNGFQDQIRQLILQQLQGLNKPVDANDPAIRGELSAQERILERVRQQRRAAAAERMASEGLNSGGQGSGAFDAEVASGFEDKGERLSGLQAQLFAREIQARRGQVQSLLNMALQSGDAEAARALQLQLANMDAELRRMGLAQQASQWGDQYGLAVNAAQYERDRDAARAQAGQPF